MRVRERERRRKHKQTIGFDARRRDCCPRVRANNRAHRSPIGQPTLRALDSPYSRRRSIATTDNPNCCRRSAAAAPNTRRVRKTSARAHKTPTREHPCRAYSARRVSEKIYAPFGPQRRSRPRADGGRGGNSGSGGGSGGSGGRVATAASAMCVSVVIFKQLLLRRWRRRRRWRRQRRAMKTNMRGFVRQTTLDDLPIARAINAPSSSPPSSPPPSRRRCRRRRRRLGRGAFWLIDRGASACAQLDHFCLADGGRHASAFY